MRSRVDRAPQHPSTRIVLPSVTARPCRFASDTGRAQPHSANLGGFMSPNTQRASFDGFWTAQADRGQRRCDVPENSGRHPRHRIEPLDAVPTDRRRRLPAPCPTWTPYRGVATCGHRCLGRGPLDRGSLNLASRLVHRGRACLQGRFAAEASPVAREWRRQQAAT